MQAMVLKKLGTALEWTHLADRQPGAGEIRVKVAACGVCRTDLHVVDGELPGSLSTVEPVSAPPKWKLKNGEQRPASETRPARTEKPEIAGQRLGAPT